MPRTIMRSGAPASSATTTAPAETKGETSPIPAAPANAGVPMGDLEKRLRDLGLPESAIQQALEAEAKKRVDEHAAKKAVQTSSAPVKKDEPKAAAKPETKPAPVAHDETGTETEGMSDSEYAAYMSAKAEEAEAAAAATPPPAPRETHTTDADGSEDDVPPNQNQMVIENHWSRASDGALTGDIDRTDFKMPQLKLVQGGGEATMKHNPGTLVFLDLQVFNPPTGEKATPTMRFVPVQLDKYWRENLEKNSKAKPRTLKTKEEVWKIGGTTEFTQGPDNSRVKPTWSPAARLTLLIEQPSGVDHPGFTMPLEVDGKTTNWAAAIIYLNGGAYRFFAKPIIDATNFLLREGMGDASKIVLYKRLWKLHYVREMSGENAVFNPKVAPDNVATPPDLRLFAQSLLGK